VLSRVLVEAVLFRQFKYLFTDREKNYIFGFYQIHMEGGISVVNYNLRLNFRASGLIFIVSAQHWIYQVLQQLT